jgi:hypothetical protein
MKSTFTLGNYVDVKRLEDLKRGNLPSTILSIAPPVAKINTDPDGEIKRIEDNRDYGMMNLKTLRNMRSIPQAAVQKLKSLRAVISTKESFKANVSEIISTVASIIVIIVVLFLIFKYRATIKEEFFKLINELKHLWRAAKDKVIKKSSSNSQGISGADKQLTREDSYEQSFQQSSQLRPAVRNLVRARPLSNSINNFSSQNTVRNSRETLF